MTLIFVTDLDGTLLDHHSYDWQAARPALAALRARAIPLVLASSKTAAEIAPLHAALGLGETPAIVENGAGLYRRGDTAAASDDHARVLSALDGLPPDLGAGFRGFTRMGPAEVARHTGLSLPDARLACTRHFTEPGLWQGDDATLQRFLAALAAQGIAARRGGRFLTLSLGRTKADAMAELRRALGATRIVALGDAPNDAQMLEAAETGIIIRNDHGTPIPPLPGEATGRIRRTDLPGPAGWNAAVLEVLDAPTPD